MVLVDRFLMPPQLGLCSLWLLLAALEFQLKLAESANLAEAEKHLEMGRQLLAKGQFQDAVEHFHRAIEEDPSNYLTYFRRATAFLALGKARAALPDLDQVIKLKPDFVAARMQRGNVYMKQGRLDEAHIDFEAVLRYEPHHVEAMQSYADIEPIKADMEHAQIAFEEGAYPDAINMLSGILERCPWSVELREMRAESYLRMGDYVNAISDFKSTVKLTPDNTIGHLRVSKLHYNIGEAEESLTSVRECLKLDPDLKSCFDHYKKVKKLAKMVSEMEAAFENERYDDCVTAAQKVKKTEPNVHQFQVRALDRLCYCHGKAGENQEAIKACTEGIRLEENPRFYCDRADAHLGLDEFDEAMADFQKASNLDERYERAREGLRRAQKLKKNAGRRNYYKILGVNKSTPKKEITKAYRKLAQKWHPDNFIDEDEKKAAEKKFMDIAAAKEVLTDPELRQKYDSGEDPLDPESQAGQQFNPFHQHFQFQGQPFQFKFHFN